MRIISNFHDYYDGIQTHGSDPALIYKRTTDYIPFDKEELYIDKRYWWNESQFSRSESIDNFFWYTILIGFCGEIYRAIKFKDLLRYKDANKTLYSTDDIKKMYLDHSRKLEKSNMFNQSRWSGNNNYKDLVKRFKANINESKLTRLFEELKIPCFVITNNQAYTGLDSPKDNSCYLITNPQLSQFDFYKIKDPYTTYQDIAMYLSGVLGMNTPDTVEISDSSKIQKKGFDKWSFRKLPGKKKPRRKK